MQDYFHANERVDQALAERDHARDVAAREPASEEAQENLRLRIVWATRVTQWRNNIEDDLKADSVPAPGSSGRRWLFFQGATRWCMSDATLSCDLCEECSGHLSNTKSTGEPSVRMPPSARARGLWNGPEPVEIQVLTYAERLVLRLARVYQTVKRISEHIARYAAGNTDALPQ